MEAIVTGGAGFIGSHLVDRLILDGWNVTVLDNLSSGKKEFVNENAELYITDLLHERSFRMMKDVDVVFHLAANPDVRIGAKNTDILFENNVIATYNLMEGIRKTGVEKVVFTSTSTVYGEAEVFPTPEDHPAIPISVYGATKLACEAIIASYAHTFEINAWIFRLANVIGRRSTHGVIYDFIKKLMNDPERLEILGDGNQKKSYIHVEDCVDAMIHAFRRASDNVNIFNIGNRDQISVKRIAEIVSREMNLNPEFIFTGGKRGWKGDVPVMLLSIKKLEALGWEPKYTSEMAVRKSVKELLRDMMPEADP